MAKAWDKWLPFFEKYQDRILYGTDYYAFPDDDKDEWRTCFLRRPVFVRQFFETDTEHEYIGEQFRGVKLDKKLLKKIYAENAESLLGKPKRIDEKYMITEALRLLSMPEKQSKYAEEDLKFIISEIENDF